MQEAKTRGRTRPFVPATVDKLPSSSCCPFAIRSCMRLSFCRQLFDSLARSIQKSDESERCRELMLIVKLNTFIPSSRVRLSQGTPKRISRALEPNLYVLTTSISRHMNYKKFLKGECIRVGRFRFSYKPMSVFSVLSYEPMGSQNL